MVSKYLGIIILLALTACHENSPQSGDTKPTQAPTVPTPDNVAPFLPKEKWIRFVEAEYDIDGKTVKIENLGWCKSRIVSKEMQNIFGNEKCSGVYDYSKIQEDGKTYYLYRSKTPAEPFEKIIGTASISNIKTTSSKKWDEAITLKSKATTFSVKRSVSLQEWKYSLSVLHKLHMEKCKSSKYYQIAQRNPPLNMKNRLLNMDGIFYFDVIFNGVTVMEIDLKNSRIVGFGTVFDSHKSVSEFDWDNQAVLNSRNNEVTSYEDVYMGLLNPLVRLDIQWFYTNCSIYYNSVNNKINIYRNPSLTFFPTYNSKYDAEISKEVDRVLEMQNMTIRNPDTDYKPILSRNEVEQLIPAKENLPQNALQFLIKGGFETYSLEQFKRSL